MASTQGTMKTAKTAADTTRPTVVLQLIVSWPLMLCSRIHKAAPDAGRALRSRVALPIVSSALALGVVSVLLIAVAAPLTQPVTTGSDQADGRVASGSSATLLKHLDSALVSAPWVSCERHPLSLDTRTRISRPCITAPSRPTCRSHGCRELQLAHEIRSAR